MIFISCEKFFFFLRSLHFFPCPFGYVEKRLDKKATVNFKIYDVTNWNISRNKGKQAMKFGQLIKFSVRNTFLQLSSKNWGRETNSRPRFVFSNSSQHLSFKNTKKKHFRLLIQVYAQFRFFKKGSRTSFSTGFCV